MFRMILAIFILVPAIEITLLIMLGHLVGGWMTFLLIIASGFLGAYFAKREGRKVMEYAKFEWSQGQLPARHLLDGICIFLGGILLITPGFITDIFGFPARLSIHEADIQGAAASHDSQTNRQRQYAYHPSQISCYKQTKGSVLLLFRRCRAFLYVSRDIMKDSCSIEGGDENERNRPNDKPQ